MSFFQLWQWRRSPNDGKRVVAEFVEVGAITVSRVPFIIVVSGPSGVGKSTVVSNLLEHSRDVKLSISLTTRSPRPGEEGGGEYYFVTSEEFLSRRKAGDLLEWAEVHGYLYGTPEAFIDEQLANGIKVLLEIDVQGSMQVKTKRPDAVLIFLLPPSFEELERRLRNRGTDDVETISRRLRNAKEELEYYDRYDYLVVNDEVGRCTEDVLSIIRAESLRRERTGIAE
jgi:guanylate kinase